MAIDTPFPPQIATDLSRSFDKLTRASEQQTAATIAAAIIVARGHPTSVAEALEITNTVHMAMHPPPPSSGFGQKWEKEKAEKLAKIHT